MDTSQVNNRYPCLVFLQSVIDHQMITSDEIECLIQLSELLYEHAPVELPFGKALQIVREMDPELLFFKQADTKQSNITITTDRMMQTIIAGNNERIGIAYFVFDGHPINTNDTTLYDPERVTCRYALLEEYWKTYGN